MSDHTIASSQQLNLLKKRNTYQREVIEMLIEEVNNWFGTVHVCSVPY